MDERIPKDVIKYLGNGVFVDDVQETAQAIHVRLGLEYPELLKDPASGDQLLSFISLHNVSSMKFVHATDRLIGPRIDRQGFFEQAEGRRHDLVTRAESAMVAAAKNQIVKVQPIGTGLNPIREILVYVNEENELNTKLFRKGNQQRYVPLLTSLGYLTEQRGTLRPGPELEKFSLDRGEVRGTPEFYSALLGEILRKGYREIRDALNVNLLEPIVRTANAYYWPSHRIGRPLEFKARDFDTYLKLFHPKYSVNPLKLRNHLVEMAAAGIVEKNGSTYTADSNVWERYEQEASRDQSLAV